MPIPPTTAWRIVSLRAPVVDFGFLSPAAYGFLTAPDPSATITLQGSTLSVAFGDPVDFTYWRESCHSRRHTSGWNGPTGTPVSAESQDSNGHYCLARGVRYGHAPGTSECGRGRYRLPRLRLSRWRRARASTSGVQARSLLKAGNSCSRVNDATLTTSDCPRSARYDLS